MQKLKMEGIGIVQITFTRISLMTIIMWFLSLILYFGVIIISSVFQLNILYFQLKGIWGLFILCISMASFFHMVYSIPEDSINGTVFLLILNTIMILSSGILLPSTYFPDYIDNVSVFFPLNYWNQYCREYIIGNGSLTMVFPLIGISIVSVGIGSVALWKNM